MTWLITLALKAVNASQYGPVIIAALALKNNPSPDTEKALLDAAKNLGESEDPALTNTFENADTLGHAVIDLTVSRSPATIKAVSNAFVNTANALAPKGKQVPQAHLDALENDVTQILSDEGIAV